MSVPNILLKDMLESDKTEKWIEIDKKGNEKELVDEENDK